MEGGGNGKLWGMSDDTQALFPLIAFRTELYQSVLGHRKDSLFELTEAALCASGPEPLVRLSTLPAFRRRWPSACDGLADGSLDTTRLRRLFVGALPTPPAEERELWVIDGTTWPRPAAATSPERTYCHRVAPGIPQTGVVPGWESQWLVALAELQGSWVLPLDVTRRGPTAGSPTTLALAQLRSVLRSRPAGAPRPLAVLDSGYDPVGLASSEVAAQVDFLVRLAKNRVFYRQPGPYRGRGAPRKHGAAFDLKEPSTQGEAAQQASVVDPEYGRVEVTLWTGLHTRRAPRASFSVVRVQVEHLPRHRTPPAPLWLGWIGEAPPADLLMYWRWYLRRFTVEHAFRFAKQGLGWTMVRPRSPEAADRWTWLVAAVLWQLYLARGAVTDCRLPWERPLPAHQLSPGRVRRAFPGLLPTLGTPAKAPKPRGKAPGRQLGQKPGRRKRHAVTYRHKKSAA